jgi:Concanavalin A-like lectin/glucanases superfamily
VAALGEDMLIPPDWVLFGVPVIVLILMLLFRFVGCELVFKLHRPPIPYPMVVQATTGLTAYWRLNESAGSLTAVDLLPDPGGDVNGRNPGTYTTVPGGIPPDDPDSATAPGTLVQGQPSLLDPDAGNTPADQGSSVRFDGGFVDVATDTAPNPSPFTIEVWARPEWAPETAPTFHSVVTSRREEGGTLRRGYMLYAGPPIPPIPPGKDPNRTYWQAWVGTELVLPPPDGPVWEMLVGPEVVLNETAYLVMTCDGTTLALWVNGGNFVDDGTDEGTIEPNDTKTLMQPYVPAQGRPLYIAGGKTDVDPPAAPRYPFIGRLQEVAVYSAVLPVEDIARHFAMGSGTRE